MNSLLFLLLSNICFHKLATVVLKPILRSMKRNVQKKLLKLHFHNSLTGWWRVESVWDWVSESKLTVVISLTTCYCESQIHYPVRCSHIINLWTNNSDFSGFAHTLLRVSSSACFIRPYNIFCTMQTMAIKETFHDIVHLFADCCRRLFFWNEFTAVEVERDDREQLILY